MTQKSYYWDGIVTGDASLAAPDGYTANLYTTNWKNIFTRVDDEGIIDSYLNELLVSGITGGVSVASGGALVHGTKYENTSAVTITIDTPSANPRIDRIVLRKDWAARTIRITLIDGTEAGAPTAPALTQVDENIWDIPLAQVLITTAGVITVTDEREPASTPLGPSTKEHIETIIADGVISEFDFDNISPGFRHLEMWMQLRHSTSASQVLKILLNNDTGNNYNIQEIFGRAAAVVAGANASVGKITTFTADVGDPAGYAFQTKLTLFNYTSSLYKPVLRIAQGRDGTGFISSIATWLWEDTNPINQITIAHDTSSDPFVTGSTVSLYGLR